MTLRERLKLLRQDIGISQEAVGAQGFVSTPGWVKFENGQRVPSDRLIIELVEWLRKDQHVTLSAAGKILEELLTLKYLNSRSFFLRKLARFYADERLKGATIRLTEDPAVYRSKPRRSPTRSKRD